METQTTPRKRRTAALPRYTVRLDEQTAAVVNTLAKRKSLPAVQVIRNLVTEGASTRLLVEVAVAQIRSEMNAMDRRHRQQMAEIQKALNTAVTALTHQTTMDAKFRDEVADLVLPLVHYIRNQQATASAMPTVRPSSPTQERRAASNPALDLTALVAAGKNRDPE